MKMMILVFFSAAMAVSAADLTLVGDDAKVWTTSSSIWRNASGENVTFATGDNILISTDFFTGPSLRMDGRFNPGHVVFDIDDTLLFGWGANNQYGLGPDTVSFTKRGKGTLVLTDYLSGSHKTQQGEINRGNGLTNGIEIVEGEIACLDPNNHNFLGPRMVPHWVTVRNGASLTFLERNQSGTYGNPECGLNIQLDKGAVLNICTNYSDATPSTPTPLCVNILRLNGGTVNVGANWYTTDTKPNRSARYELGGNSSLYVFNKIHFSGTEKQSLGSGNDFTDEDHLISLNPHNPVEICVDDVIDGVDAEMCLSGFTWGTNTVGEYRCDLIKTGAGTLSFPNNGYNKPFKGDFKIEEGSVEFLSNTSVQNFFQADADDSLQTITVSTNTTLRIKKRNIFKPGADNTPNIKLVVDHGTLEVTPGTGNHGSLTVMDCVFDNATLNISNLGMSEQFGIFGFKNSVTFKGDRPLMMWPDETLETKRQAVSVYNGYRTCGNQNGSRTIVDVADMTGDGRTDVVMGYHIWNAATNDTAAGVMTDCGFIKTGAGTFSVASMTNRVSGVVTVAEGTMRVDGCLVTPSSVDVVTGAYLGGTGTVANVSLESGAGFSAPAGQKTPLVVEGDLVLPDTGAVDVLNLGGADEKDLPAVNLVRATGALSGTENLSGWIVKIDGVVSKNWKIEVHNGIFRAKYNNGFAVVVR